MSVIACRCPISPATPPAGIFKYNETEGTIECVDPQGINCPADLERVAALHSKSDEPLIAIHSHPTRFIFDVESTGAMPPTKIVQSALRQLQIRFGRLARSIGRIREGEKDGTIKPTAAAAFQGGAGAGLLADEGTGQVAAADGTAAGGVAANAGVSVPAIGAGGPEEEEAEAEAARGGQYPDMGMGMGMGGMGGGGMGAGAAGGGYTLGVGGAVPGQGGGVGAYQGF